MDITRQSSGGRLHLTVAGRIDGYWADHLNTTVGEAVRQGHRRIRMDCSKVTFLSSAGIGVLVQCHKQLTAISGAFHVTNPSTASGQTEMLLVAAKKEVVNDYVQVVRDAGLIPQVVDVAAFASQNGFEANYPLDPRETVVLINIGAAISNINIVRSGV